MLEQTITEKDIRKIVRDELTSDVSLLITDFADEDEVEETEELWTSQVSELKHVLGS